MRFPLLLMCLLGATPLVSPAQVVINEIFYNAPADLDDLQYVELHNVGGKPVDLAGWSFVKGIKFKFAPGTRINPNGFVVVCRNAARFQEFYKVPVAGVFDSTISRKGERLELADAAGKLVDGVKFKDRAPWPTGADGESGSLERISPWASGDEPANWLSSPLSEDRDRPAGTPGAVNAGFSAQLPPVIASVKFTPELPALGQALVVEAEINADTPADQVRLLYRLAGPGFEKPEESLVMNSMSPGRYTATIPGQAIDQLIRFRVEAVGPLGARRSYPAETEPRPALSAYVQGPIEPAKIPFGWIVHTSEKEMKAAESRLNTPRFGGFFPPPPDPDEEARRTARSQFEQGLDVSRLWFELTARIAGGDAAVVQKLKPVFLAKLAERKGLIETNLAPKGVEGRLPSLPGVMKAFMSGVAASARPGLTADQDRRFSAWLERHTARPATFERMILGRADLEGVWQVLTLNADNDLGRLPALGAALTSLDKQRDVLLAEVAAGTGQDSGFRDQREAAEVLGDRIVATVKPHLTPAQAPLLEAWRTGPREVAVGLRNPEPVRRGPAQGFGGGPGGRGPFGGRPGQVASEPASHRSAFVYFDPATRKTELFDFVQITGRKGGQKVHFNKDRPLGQMTTIALIFEGETAALAEPLAYEVYRRAGMPVEQSYHVRLWSDGKPSGYSVLIEQPNRAFLRRNQIKDDGNMYKLLWFGGDLVGQHEKHLNRRPGHGDLVAVVDGLSKTTGEAQWEFIRKNFDVEQVAAYFAVNTVLSHWDGFFNNYFAYHDAGGTGKWMMFPWDQDSTWGLRTMGGRGGVFYDMPLTFGMNGDSPRNGGGWWRQPGFFSGPLLANPQFRKVFLARTRQILETVYSEEAFGPVIAAMEERLIPEVQIRATAQGQNAAAAVANLKSELARCREHLRLRREFLLSQAELKNLPAGK